MFGQAPQASPAPVGGLFAGAQGGAPSGGLFGSSVGKPGLMPQAIQSNKNLFGSPSRDDEAGDGLFSMGNNSSGRRKKK